MSVRGNLIFATYAAQPAVTEDDRVLVAALERRGVVVRAAAWDDPRASWSDADGVIVRSTWDYHLRRDQFLDWTERVAADTALYNVPAVIRWNSHKSYLTQLAARDVPVIDTVFASAGSCVDVAALATAHRWGEIVIKPAVSASAYETRRFSSRERAAGQAHVDRLLRSVDVMLQPHLATLAERGELAVMFAGGRFTHAVRRRSALAAGDAMPKSAAATAAPAAVRLAERVLAESIAAMGRTEPPLYARVDLAEHSSRAFQLLELELIEPSLFFLHAPDAAEQMAESIAEAVR